MQPGKIFYLINSKSKIDLLDKSVINLFGSIEYFKNAIFKMFNNVINDSDGVITLKTEDSVLIFYYGDEAVIEKFVMVDVLLSDDPLKDVTSICKMNKWLLFDFEAECYIDL
jgi:hypothetical protein